MRALIQRISKGQIDIPAHNYSATVGKGLLLLLGVKNGDSLEACLYLAAKAVNQRIFEDADGKMNLSVKDINGEILIVSQFTLYADTKKGNRPGFSEAAPPHEAIPLYERFIEEIKMLLGAEKVKTGIFGASMDITFTNSGPVTILLER